MAIWDKITTWITQKVQKPSNKASPTLPNALYKPFQDKINALIVLCQGAGLNVGPQQGLRSFKEQDALYAQGRTKPGKIVTKAKGGQSWHNYGIAVDLVFRENNQWSWDDKHPWNTLGALGKGLGLEWGGDWEFKDRPHFQWPKKISLTGARMYYQKGGLQEVWKHI